MIFRVLGSSFRLSHQAEEVPAVLFVHPAQSVDFDYRSPFPGL